MREIGACRYQQWIEVNKIIVIMQDGQYQYDYFQY